MQSAISIEQLRNPATRERAFEALVREQSPVLYATIRRIVQYHDDADDVLQNTFVKAWLALDAFRGDSQVSSWLYRIAVNESLSFLERQRPAESLSGEDVSESIRSLASDPYFDGDETQRQLQEAIATLPDKQRVVFNLKYFEDIKYEEMSEMLHTSVGALKASYHLAVKKIEAFFQSHD